MTNLVASNDKTLYPGNKKYKELVMQVLVNLKFSNGDFEHGFDKIMLCAGVVNCEKSTELEVKLPPAPLIPDLYQSWQEKYSELVETSRRNVLTIRGFIKQQPANISHSERQKECSQYAVDLRIQINQWLTAIKSQLETKFELDKNSDILLTINTENIASQFTKDILHRLPWREWDYFNQNSAFEAVLCLNEFESNPSSTTDGNTFRRVRITSIFGDSTCIDVNGDRQLITKLQKRGAELINLEQPQRQDFIKLWDEPCDILFYSGHSESSDGGAFGSLQINAEDSLNLQEIRNTFREAINKGLKLAIFNSCDGLGLAKQLADLHLPYVIVWREQVPDKIAQKFIEYFLSSYADGKSLFNSVRDARIKLIELTNSAEKEKQIPGLEWLPIICQNTIDAPPTWDDLGGLTGKLPDSPYQGLSAFGEEDAPYFFGRDDVITDLVEAVNSKPLVPVIGASGSGKSSVVFAGLVPQLKNIGNVEIVSFRPGKNPFDALTVAFNQIQQIESSNSRLEELEVEVNLEHDEKALCKLIENLKTLSSRRFVIIADQFEELYTLTEDSLRQSFLDLLLYTIQNNPDFSLVLTLRVDFLGKVLDYQPMGKAFKKYPSILLTPMSPDELGTVIEQPATKMKVELEQGLAKKLIDDLGNQPGRLPLLEFTLSLLWEKHDKWYLTHNAYEEIGGLEKALAKYADGVLNPLSAVDKEKAERIFIQLIRPGEGTEDTKRKATRGEVGEENWDLVEQLANRRLVVTGWDESSQQETVEIVHEALIREWGMLRGWIQSNRRFRIWQEQLQLEVVKWLKKCENREEKYLLSGGNLGEAEGWYFDEKYRDYLSDVQGEFIRESLDARDRKIKVDKRKQKWLAGLSVVSLFFAGFAGLNWGKAEISATISKVDSLRVNSEYLFGVGQYENALIEAIKAQQLLDISWFRNFIQTENQQKLQMAIYKPINQYWLGKKYTLSGHKHVINNLVFSPDGKIIASASADRKVKLWSTINGKIFHTLLGNKSDVSSLVFSSDSKTIISASDNGIVKLWSVSSGELIKTLSINKSPIHSVKISSNGKIIASASADGKIRLWSVSNGKVLKTLSVNKSHIKNLEFSGDNQIIASASADGKINLWSVTSGELLKTLSVHKSPINSIKISNDNKIIAAASSNGTVKLLSMSTGKLLKTLSRHSSEIDTVEFSNDGETIASVSKDHTIKLWSIDGELLHTLSGLSMIFSSDGETIASASKDNTIKLWSVEKNKLIQSLSGHKNRVRSATFSPDGKIIASASDDKTVKLWSASSSQLLHTLSGHKDTVYSLKFSSDGKIIASASGDGTAKIWSVNSGQLLHTLSGHKSAVYSAEISPNSKTISSASSDGTVKIWSADSGKLIHTLSGHKNEVFNVKFSSDGKIIASASRDRTVKLWSADSGKLIHTLSGHKNWIYRVEFSPVSVATPKEFGTTVASASADKTVKIWSANTGKLLYTLSKHQGAVNNAKFSPDGTTIASTSEDKTVKLWSASNGKLLYVLSGHKSYINSLQFSPDSKTIVSTSRDKTVKLWSVLDGRLIHTLSGHKSGVNSAEFSPDGKNIISSSDDGTIKLWNWDFDDLITKGCSKLKGYLIHHPEKLQEITTCQKSDILTYAASTLVKQGEKLAKDGNYEGAVQKFRKAKTWNPKLNIDPKVKAKAIILITEGIGFAQRGKIQEAIAAYKRAIQISPGLQVTVQDWNKLCWNGSLYEYSTEVMFACEKAVALAPLDEDIIDSRGLARALIGDYKGAIQDFETFVEHTYNSEAKSQRQAWIEDLRDGKNPFTEEVREKLRR